MNTRIFSGIVAVATGAILVASASPAAAQFKDVLVQAPRLGAPERGSLQGSLAGIGFTPSELSRGAYRLPLPISIPSDRGPILMNVIPMYSPDGGLSEWGMGWTVDLSIRRYRLIGDIDYISDDFMSPWGRLRQGSDGTFYSNGLAATIRARLSGADWVVTDADGTEYRFSAAAGVTMASGTYSWHLAEVVNLVGDRTTLEWTKNASGRPFLARVSWGGRNGAAQYELALTYHTAATVFVDHTTGAALDRQVAGVMVSARDATTGEFRERWRYELRYRDAAFGPAFYLETIRRVFASGDAQPATTYRYQLDDAQLPNASLERYTGLDTVLQTLGDTALQPDHAAIHDLDADGRQDFEHAAQLGMIQHTDAGWIQSPLPGTTGEDPRCRPPASDSNPPRVLARMTGDVGEPHVLYTRRRATSPLTSQVLLCNRLGHPLADLVVPDDWQLGPNIRLADIDRDRRPDLVRISRSGIDILHNESDADGFRFVPLPRWTWTLDATPTVSWLNDFDGDGNVDVTVRSQTGLSVQFGLGGHRWTMTPTLFRFMTLTGAQLGSIPTYQVTFVDANKDGLADVLLTKGINVWLYTNRGDVFREVPVSGFRNVQSGFGLPIVADLTGRGNIEVAFPTLGTAYIVPLATPATGLLTSADDGMGTVARFTYTRSAPRAGIEQRITLLDTLTVESSGYDTVSYSYQYGPPILHTVGKQLVGFTSVDKQSPLLTEHIAFLNDDDISGVQSLSEDHDDRTPGIVRFTHHLYEDALLHGVRWLRPSSVETGHRSTDGSVTLSSTTQYTLYERDVCPTVVITSTPSGQLISSTALASVAAMPDELHCLASSQTLLGVHAGSSLDFNYLVDLARNDLGQVTRVTQFDPAMHPLVLQDIAYDTNHRIASIGAPGRGTTAVTYDGVGRLATITDPVGIVTQASMLDPVSDAPLGLQTVRQSATVTSFFQYDGRERLQASWDDFLGGTPAQPLMSYAYQDTTNTSPGRIDTHTLADAIVGISRHGVALVSADGEPLVAGAWLGDHFSLGASSITFRSTLIKRGSFVGTMSDETLSSMTSSELRERGTTLREDVLSGTGRSLSTTTTYQADVVGTVVTELVLGATALVTRVHQPGGFTAESAIDAAGQLVSKTDERGIIHRYSHDALGRLVRIDTPDGAHTVTFDGFGRPMHIAREGIGGVTYAYDLISGLQVQRQQLDAIGAVVDTSETVYDAIGRPIQIAHTAANDSSNVLFDYDGQLGTTTVPGQLGRLNRVHGDGWERSELFDPLGRAFQQRITLTGWRDLVSDKTYRADGSIASDTLTITDGSGAIRFASTKETQLDGLGRVSALKVDGAVLYTLSYDHEGRLARADFTSGEAILFEYDPVTHQLRGYTIQAPDAAGGVRWEREPRGLVAAEIYDHGTSTTRRDYDYDGRGSLTRAISNGEVTSYSYTASGLPSTIDDGAGNRSVHRSSSTLTVSDTTYTWDSMGRVVGKGEWSFEYGASGQLTRASRPGRQVEFVYDDGNQRILKRIGGLPVRANIADGVLTEDRFVELVTVGGVVAGVLDNGQFVALLTDPRGTPFARTDGTQDMASPYGVRGSHSDLAEVIDYARLGWDPDLDVVRMGVRDYDPRLSQFLTPDPFYFEDIDACAESPIECNLYGYALNNPISFTDPSGKWIWIAVAVGYALAELRGTANAPTHDTPRERIIPSPTTGDLAKTSARLFVSGAAAGGAASLASNAIIRGAAAGATGSVVSRAFNDVDQGKFSGPHTYVRDAALGGLAGASLGGLDKALARPERSRLANEPVVRKGPIPDQQPNNLAEQLTLLEARAIPNTAMPAIRGLADEPRLVANYGPGEWVKMHHTHYLPNNGGPIVVHWFRNKTTGQNVEFKFKVRAGDNPGTPSPDPVSPTGNTRPRQRDQ